MALYHFSVSQIKRSAGQSALAAAAYRAGERLYSEYYDEISDYTRKGGVLHTEILLPAHAPERFRDRATLWNAVEAAERHPKAQLAYSFDIALQNELSLRSNRLDVGREFEVLVEGVSKRSDRQLFGRTSQNKVVVFDRGDARVGDYVRVRVTDCSSATLHGQRVE